MAYIQSYFRVDDNPNVPMFAQVWNGFMMERTQMNYRILDAELKAMGQDELAAQEKIIRNNIKEYEKIKTEAASATEENTTELVKGMAAHKIAEMELQSKHALELEEQKSNRMKAIGGVKKDRSVITREVEKTLRRRDDFSEHLKSVDVLPAFSHMTTQASKIYPSAAGQNYNQFLLNYNETLLDPLLKGAGLPAYEKLENSEERKIVHSLLAAKLEEKLAEKLNDPSVRETEKLIFETNMAALSQAMNFDKYAMTEPTEKATTYSVGLRAKQFEERANVLNAYDDGDFHLYMTHMMEAFPTPSRLNMLKSARLKVLSNVNRLKLRDQQQFAAYQNTLPDKYRGEVTFEDWMYDQIRDGAKFADYGQEITVDFEGDERNLSWLNSEIKHTERLTRGPGGSPKINKAFNELLRSINPQAFYQITGYNPKKGDPLQSRKMMEAQAAIDGARDDLATIRARRTAKFRFEKMGGGPDIFKKFQSNYLLDNPFKRRSSVYQTASKFANEFKQVKITPAAGSEKSTKYEGLERGKDYALPQAPGFVIGLTRDDMPYLKELETGNIDILDKSDGDYDMYAGILRQRKMRLVAEEEQRLRDIKKAKGK